MNNEPFVEDILPAKTVDRHTPQLPPMHNNRVRFVVAYSLAPDLIIRVQFSALK